MPSYQTPGVYVEEVSSGIKPIAGVGTSTAGFIGVLPDAPSTSPGVSDTEEESDVTGLSLDLPPIGEPRLCTNFTEFTKQFGDFGAFGSGEDTHQGHNFLAHAVYGFFNNGGTRCWVARVEKATDIVNNTQLSNPLEGFKGIDEIALVAFPGEASDAARGALLEHCEDDYLQDRFAILDPPKSPENLNKNSIQGAVSDSSYGAIYYPWIKAFNPGSQGIISVPPSGHIAGIYARVDATRGVFKAPANEVIRGALGVETVVTKEKQSGLNPEGINVIRQFDGNITLWGARTLASAQDAEWQYINVRRLFLFLRESIENGTQWVVFEPNDPALWAKITRNITAFLTNVWRDGALLGNTPQEAFYVQCDAETNPDSVRKEGQVVTKIGVAVTKPAEFVIFRISQWSGTGN